MRSEAGAFRLNKGPQTELEMGVKPFRQCLQKAKFVWLDDSILLLRC